MEAGRRHLRSCFLTTVVRTLDSAAQLYTRIATF